MPGRGTASGIHWQRHWQVVVQVFSELSSSSPNYSTSASEEMTEESAPLLSPLWAGTYVCQYDQGSADNAAKHPPPAHPPTPRLPYPHTSFPPPYHQPLTAHVVQLTDSHASPTSRSLCVTARTTAEAPARQQGSGRSAHHCCVRHTEG